MTTVQPIPNDMHSVTPHLVCKGAADAIAFYVKAFGAVELARLPVKFTPTDEMIQLPDLHVAAMSLASLSLSLNTEGDKSDE